MMRRLETTRVMSTMIGAVLAVSVLVPWVSVAEELIGIPFTVYGIDPGRPFTLPRGIFCDRAEGEILVADAGGHRIQIFDSEGWPKFEFTHWVERNQEMILGEPAAVVATPAGNIFIVDTLSDDLFIVNFRGQPLDTISMAQILQDEPEASLATCLALGPKGHVFVVCRTTNGHYLVELNGDGWVIDRTRIGNPGDLAQVTGIAVTEDRIYISDLAAASCVQVFDRSGRRELAFGVHDTGWGNFSFPAAIAVTSEGNIWVVDQIRQIVNRFDAEGKFVGFIGGQGSGPGSMSYPCAVATDRSDRILVLEKVGRRLQAFVMPKGGTSAADKRV